MVKLDCHCHLDQYKDPKAITTEAVKREVFIIAMTNLPSHFKTGLQHTRNLPGVRLALGLHPLATANYTNERKLFSELLGQTSYIGEVGLDFSREGKDTRDLQLTNFRFIIDSVAKERKVISLHSRGAESTVIDILTEFKIPVAIFHWYTGSLSLLDEAISRGNFLSINPAMVNSQKGRQIIARIPPDRVLTETDGPYIKVGRVPVRPWDIAIVENHLMDIWGIQIEEVQNRVWNNFQRLLCQLGLSKTLSK
jgi:TatD DNase family protein